MAKRKLKMVRFNPDKKEDARRLAQIDAMPSFTDFVKNELDKQHETSQNFKNGSKGRE